MPPVSGSSCWSGRRAEFSRVKTDHEKKRASGLRHPDPPPRELDRDGVVDYYLDHFEREFVRTRREAKRRSVTAVVARAVLGGVGTVLGAASAAASTELFPALIGIAIAFTSAASAVFAIWDGHFRHEQLWVQRTVVLGELSRVRLQFEFNRRVAKEAAAGAALGELERVLKLDVSTWMALRGADAAAPDAGESQAEGGRPSLAG